MFAPQCIQYTIALRVKNNVHTFIENTLLLKNANVSCKFLLVEVLASMWMAAD